MYGCESWTIKKAECQRIYAFEPWCWRRLLRAPWTARRSNQSILQEINPEYSLEGPMLKLQYFGHLMCRADSLGKTLVLGKTEGKRKSGQQRAEDEMVREHHWVNGHESEQEIVKDTGTWHAAVHRLTESDTTEQQLLIRSWGELVAGEAQKWVWCSRWAHQTRCFLGIGSRLASFFWTPPTAHPMCDTGSSTFQENNGTDLWTKGCTPFTFIGFQNKGRGEGENIKGTEQKRSEQKRTGRLLTPSPCPHL